MVGGGIVGGGMVGRGTVGGIGLGRSLFRRRMRPEFKRDMKKGIA